MSRDMRYRGNYRGPGRARPEVSQHYRRWTPKEDERLVMLWGTATLRKLSAEFGRTQLTVYWRARGLKLTCGVPRGFEYISVAATRTGFDTGQLRRILRAAGVKVRLAMARPKPGRTHHFHFVDPIDVDDAVAAWAGEETPHVAAIRTGTSDSIVRAALVAAGHEPPTLAGAHWRLPSATIDAALTAYRPGPSVSQHAIRVGLSRNTLAKRLRLAGVLGAKCGGAGGEVRLANDVVDAALERLGLDARGRRHSAGTCGGR